ncbi:Hypothetical predicted protein [Olea europaea subsp. europaea]|uniref:Xylanase inhibitor C-terminal domain-containing protein n=1 Tax=Olea europaea subsp. europaea TaxID=158383 RepID=A0A8S0VA27_OLEEU|nr:Hypothetical predicted protein [Olea europaea subsp. europaea]
MCALGEESSVSSCLNQNQCGYKFQYGDGSGASGYYVSDLMYFDTIVGDSSTSKSSALVFGLGILLNLKGQSMGVAPNAFSHCLNGDNGGVYTPLVPSQPHYNINLQSISVNGQELSIDPSVFATSTNQGTIVDSRTTLAYLAEEAYDPFVTAIMQAVSPLVRPLLSKGNPCYLTTFSLVHWLQKIQDLLMQNKIVVYDLAGQRIGWTDCDCSSSVNVSTTTRNGKTEFVNAGEIGNSSPTCNYYNPVPTTFVALLLHALVFGIYTFR